MTTPDWIASAISTYGYAALFLATVVEGPIATVIGAFLAAQGLLQVDLVYAIAVAGDLVGDLLFYLVGRSGKLGGHVGWNRLNERRRKRLAVLREQLRAHPAGPLLLGKLTHAAGFLVLLAAGAARVPIVPFLGFNLLGTLPKVALFVLIGYFAGAAYNRIDTYLWIASCALFVVVLLGIGLYLRRRLALDPPEA